MRWAISSHQCDFFQNNELIEFENFLSTAQTHKLMSVCKNGIETRLGITAHEDFKRNPEEVFMKGRDLFRENLNLKKQICDSKFSRIAAELTHATNLRLACDQLIASTHFVQYFLPQARHFNEFMKQPHSLMDLTSFQGVVCGVMLCLSKDQEATIEGPEKEQSLKLSVYPAKPGNAVFFKPSHTFSFQDLYGKEDALYLLIVYCQAKTTYVFQPNDIHTHALKNLGYVFGDSLTEKYHPTVYRR